MAKHSHERARRRAQEAHRYLILWRSTHFEIKFVSRYNKLTEDEFFALQEKYAEEDFKNAKKSLDNSRWGGSGKKSFKKPYRRLSRRQGKAICDAYLYDDEEKAESITPEGFMGSIGWDIC